MLDGSKMILAVEAAIASDVRPSCLSAALASHERLPRLIIVVHFDRHSFQYKIFALLYCSLANKALASTRRRDLMRSVDDDPSTDGASDWAIRHDGSNSHQAAHPLQEDGGIDSSTRARSAQSPHEFPNLRVVRSCTSHFLPLIFA